MSILEKSNLLNTIRNRVMAFQQLHLFRYGHFVKSSPHKEDCRYAVATKQRYLAEGESDKIRAELIELRNDINDLLSKLED